MKAGKDLDALIAVHVMGMEVEPVLIPKWEGLIKPGAVCLYEEKMLPKAIPHYSTSIDDAWDVAQKIKDADEDNEFSIEFSHSKHNECEVSVFFKNKEGDMCGPYYLLGESAPHAICLAALKAVGYEPTKEKL